MSLRSAVMVAAFAVALALASCGERSTPALDGRWLVGDGSGRFHTLLDVEGEGFRALRLEKEAPRKGRFEATTHGDGRVTLHGEGERTIEVFLEGPHHARGILPGETGLAFARRVGALPEHMVGEWTVAFSDNYHLAGGSMFLRPDRWVVTVGSNTARDLPAHPLATGGPLADLVVVNDRGQGRHLRFTSAGAGQLLAWFAGTDEYFILHRGADRPEWLPPERPTRDNPFVEDAP